MAFNGLFKWLPFGSTPSVSADKLNHWLNTTELQVLDVRTQREYRTSHIPGAINLPIVKFSRENVNALRLDKSLPVVAICLSAHRSIPAVRQLKAMGFTQAYQLEGGMKAWWKESFPVF